MTATAAAASIVVESPVGRLLLTSDGSALTGVHFGTDPPPPTAIDPPDEIVAEAASQLVGYFAGQRTHFDLPLAAKGTEFQQRVWAQLRAIPYGATASYGDVAARMGIPASASRAVGLANGANPLAIVVPCHRVIGSDGTLVGYAGGLHRKRFLLALESPSVQEPLFLDEPVLP